MQNPAYQVKAKLSIELLKQLLHQVDAMTSLVLVGDLSQFRASGLTDVTRDEIVVEDAVFQASHGRLSIPLSGNNKYIVKKEILPSVGIKTRIRDVQLVRYGRLLFSAPNHFKDDILIDSWFQPEFLHDLQNDGIIQIAHAQTPIAPKQTHTTVNGFRFVTR